MPAGHTNPMQPGVFGGRSRLAAHPGDYNNIYSDDPYMEEMSDEARVWRIYNDEADRIDAELIEGWTGNLDNQLVFAGLFSGVVATFVIQSSQSLQPDYSATTASLLTEIAARQRAADIGGNGSVIPASALDFNTSFSPLPQMVWLNGLWLVSLVLSLSTALVTGIIKQWLHFYISDVTGPSRLRACTRQFRFMGLLKWGVPPMIETLPVLMNISLLLFFLGLILFCQLLTSTTVITWTIGCLTFFFYAFYIGTSILPFFYSQSPFKSSLSRITWYFIKPCLLWKLKAERLWRAALTSTLGYEIEEIYAQGVSKLTRTSGISTFEAQSIQENFPALQIHAISEMAIRSTNPSVPNIALQSLAALHGRDDTTITLPASLQKALYNQFRSSFHNDGAKGFIVMGDPAVCERLARAVLLSRRDGFGISYKAKRGSVALDLKEHVLGWDDLARVNALSDLDPSNPYYAALRMFLIRHGTGHLQKANARDAVEFMLNKSSINRNMTFNPSPHKWVCEQFEAAVETTNDWTPISNSVDICLHLMKTLSTDETPQLQEAIMIRYLHAELNYDSKGRQDNFQITHDRLNVCILRILPKLATTILSVKSEQASNQLFRFLVKLLGSPSSSSSQHRLISFSKHYVQINFWNDPSEREPVRINLREAITYPCTTMCEPERSLLHALDGLLQEIVLKAALAGCLEESDDILPRVDTILRLFEICHGSSSSVNSRHPVFVSVIQWLSEHLHPCYSESLLISLESTLQNFFDNIFGGSVRAIDALKETAITGRLRGIPVTVIKGALLNLNNPKWQMGEDEWRLRIDQIFRSLALPSIDPTFEHLLQRQEDRWSILSSLIDIVSSVPQVYPLASHWEEMLESWRLLLLQELSDGKTSSVEGSSADGGRLKELVTHIESGGRDLFTWRGSMRDCFGSALYLNFNPGPRLMNEHYFRSALHALLVLTYHKSVRTDDLDVDLPRRMANYFNYCISGNQVDFKRKSSWHALHVCCEYLSSTPVCCLPSEISETVLLSMSELLHADDRFGYEDAPQRSVLHLLDDLFRQFLRHDPRGSELDIDVRKACVDRWRTLSDFIKFTSQPDTNYSAQESRRDLLFKWKRQLQERCRRIPGRRYSISTSVVEGDAEEEVELRGLIHLIDRNLQSTQMVFDSSTKEDMGWGSGNVIISHPLETVYSRNSFCERNIWKRALQSIRRLLPIPYVHDHVPSPSNSQA